MQKKKRCTHLHMWHSKSLEANFFQSIYIKKWAQILITIIGKCM